MPPQRTQVESRRGGSNWRIGSDVLSGTGSDDTLSGDNGNDTLRGGGGDDVLDDDSGNDILYGGTGDDIMVGGTGNHSYIVGSAGDIVIETDSASVDLVKSYVDYALGAYLENLYLVGLEARAGNALANSIKGNEAANTLAGLRATIRSTRLAAMTCCWAAQAMIG